MKPIVFSNKKEKYHVFKKGLFDLDATIKKVREDEREKIINIINNSHYNLVLDCEKEALIKEIKKWIKQIH